jgi:hypothetical protein
LGQGLLMRLLTYLTLQYCAQPNKGNPLHRIFTYFWANVLDKSRRIRSLASKKVGAAASAAAPQSEITEPLLSEN